MNIILCCAGGMSTSFVVTRMKKAAKEMGLDCKIWAIAEDDLEYESGYDVVLLGPQISSAITEVEEEVDDHVAVAVIPKDMYGKCDGEGILKYALKVREEKDKK